MTLGRAAADLLARIEAFGLSPPEDPLGFETRLADDQGWTLGYALAVTEQYRRFLVLTQVAGQPVGPSPDVDQAWHLHLTRTAHYDAFCNAVFGRFLHHEPARPGQGARHRDMYAHTLEAYRRAFGADAPLPTWPEPGQPRETSAIAPPPWPVPAPLQGGRRLASVAVLSAIVVGAVLARGGLLAPLHAIGSFAFLGLAVLATVALGWRGLRARTAPARTHDRDILEPYEAAWLSGGTQRMAMTAIVALTERGVLLPPGKPPQHGPRPPIPVNATVEPRCVHPAEVACVQAIDVSGLRFRAACLAMAPLADQFERRLVRAGLASDVRALPLQRARALAGMVVLLSVEFERLFHGFGMSRRVGLLMLLTLAGVGLVVVLARRPLRAGARAQSALQPLRLSTGQFKKTPPTGQALAFGVALAGGAALAQDLRFDGLGQQVNAMPLAAPGRRAPGDKGADSSGCSSCSSCGSSDGGSGGSSDGGGSSCGSSCSSGCGGGD